MIKQWFKMGLIAGVLGFLSMANADSMSLVIPNGKAVLITDSAGVVSEGQSAKTLTPSVVSQIKSCLLEKSSLWKNDAHKTIPAKRGDVSMSYISGNQTFYLPSDNVKLLGCFAPALK